jgi:hypothetical protein
VTHSCATSVVVEPSQIDTKGTLQWFSPPHAFIAQEYTTAGSALLFHRSRACGPEEKTYRIPHRTSAPPPLLLPDLFGPVEDDFRLAVEDAGEAGDADVLVAVLLFRLAEFCPVGAAKHPSPVRTQAATLSPRETVCLGTQRRRCEMGSHASRKPRSMRHPQRCCCSPWHGRPARETHSPEGHAIGMNVHGQDAHATIARGYPCATLGGTCAPARLWVSRFQSSR